MNFAVDAGFAHTPRDQLRVLRAEINDQQALTVNVGHWLTVCIRHFRHQVLANGIVGRFLGDRNIVHMTLYRARGTHAHKMGFGAHRRNRATPRVDH